MTNYDIVYSNINMEVVRILVNNGIQFHHEDIYDGKVNSVITEELPIRIADKLLSKFKSDQISTMKIGTKPGKVIVVIQISKSDIRPAQITVGELIDKLSQFPADMRVVMYNNVDKTDCFVTDITSSEVVDDDMYGNYLRDFPPHEQSVCADEKAGEKFVVLFGE